MDFQEGMRRSYQYKLFDRLLEKTHGGDYMGMHQWIMSKECSDQFSTKYRHDQFVTDFVNWSKNRGITFE